MLLDCLATKQNTQECQLLGISSYYGLIRYQLSLLLIMWSITMMTRQMIKSIKLLKLPIVFTSFLFPVGGATIIVYLFCNIMSIKQKSMANHAFFCCKGCATFTEFCTLKVYLSSATLSNYFLFIQSWKLTTLPDLVAPQLLAVLSGYLLRVSLSEAALSHLYFCINL